MSEDKYIGLDLHHASVSVAVLNRGGKLTMECVLETKASAIVDFIQGVRGSLAVTFEEGSCAGWLHDLLQPHVSRLVVCDPRGWPSFLKLALVSAQNISIRSWTCFVPYISSALRTGRREPSPSGGEAIAPDSTHRTDSGRALAGPGANTASIPYQATAVGLQRIRRGNARQWRVPLCRRKAAAQSGAHPSAWSQ